MLQVSDPRLDAEALRRRLQHQAEHRYFQVPLAVPPLSSVPQTSAPASLDSPVPTLRGRLKRLPWIGKGLVWGASRWARMRMPGLAPIERLRAAPIVGDGLAWLGAWLGLIGWRATLRSELAKTQAELAALQQQTVRQTLELRRLQRQVRQQTDAMQTKQPH